jgi:pantothenate kinase type III
LSAELGILLRPLRFGYSVPGIGIASVLTREETQEFIDFLHTFFPRAVVSLLSGDSSELPLKFAPGFTQKEKIGADRLANVMGAVAMKKHPCVIADFGTALTVDGVNEKGEFVGGMILPGMATLLHAMHQNTARLPDLKIPAEPFAKPFGQNTKDAMLAGVEHGYRGLVRETVAKMQDALCGKCTLLATGGMAQRVASASGLDFEILPDLTLLGIAQILNLKRAVEKGGAGSPCPPFQSGPFSTQTSFGHSQKPPPSRAGKGLPAPPLLNTGIQK